MPAFSSRTKRNGKSLADENRRLRARLDEVEETLRAIRSGEVDALVVSRPEGEQVYTLKGALEPYRVMVENMSEGAVALAGDGSITWCNSQFATLIKMAQEQVVGSSFARWIETHDGHKLAAMLAQARGGSVRETLTLVRRDGARTPIHLSLCALPDSAGSGIAAIITDITHVVAAAEARMRLASIVDSSDDAIISTSFDGIVESWNKAAERLFLYTPNEAIGRRLQQLIAPPDRAGELADMLRAIGQNEHAGNIETERLRKDGTTVEVVEAASPICDANGNVVGMALTLRDITARRRAEEVLRRANAENARLLEESRLSERRFRALIEHGADAIVVVDADGKTLYHSPAVEAIEGYEAEELESAAPTDRVHPDDIAIVEQAMRQARELPGRAVRYSWRRRHKDGHWIWLEGVTTNLLDDPAVLGIVTNYRDVTAQRKAEAEVAQQRAKELEKIAELERFQKLMVGRELKMIELKKEIEALQRAAK